MMGFVWGSISVVGTGWWTLLRTAGGRLWKMHFKWQTSNGGGYAAQDGWWSVHVRCQMTC